MPGASTLRDELQARGIRAMGTSPLPGRDGWTSLSMWAVDAERFLNMVTPLPASDKDGVALRILGRPQDLGIEDDQWIFEAFPGDTPEGKWGIRVTVNIPPTDVVEVLSRVRGSATNGR